MRAASSDLYDLSSASGERFEEIREKIKVRWWRDKEITVRLSPLGPVLTDSPFFKDFNGPPLALKWIGQMPSDEIGALLAANRAEDWETFRSAWVDYAVSGQNILYADTQGNIGQLLAVTLPKRRYTEPPDLILDPDNPDNRWDGSVGSRDLPVSFNPKEGFLASSNNVPTRTDPPTGFFFSDNDRIRRLKEKLVGKGLISPELLKELQTDVFSRSSADLRDLVLKIIDEGGKSAADDAETIDRLRTWDGRLEADSEKALAFQLFLYHLARKYYGEKLSEEGVKAVLGSANLTELLCDDLPKDDRTKTRGVIRKALNAAAGDLLEFENWGQMHRLRLNHFLGRIPIIGKRYRFVDLPAGGGSTTLMKTAHKPTNERHGAFYGSNARHVSDLSDPDFNWFLLLGGQDGRLGSEHLLDQVPLWVDRKYIQVPLTMTSVKKAFRHRIDLTGRKD